MLATPIENLRPDSTLADLPAHDFRVTADTWGNRITAELDRHPELPGVMIFEKDKLQGIISREKFLEHLSRPFALEVYMKRPISVMLKQIDMQPLELDSTLGIDEAATIALNRQRTMVYEPIVIRLPDGDVRLLGTEVLLLAQSRLLAMANDAIKRQKEEADAANLAKSRFLANMSHEIRTPMNGIIGLTGVLLETSPTSQQREYLELVRSSADWLLVVINDILDFSKIEAGKLELEQIEFSLRNNLGDLLKPLAFRAHGKGLELVSDVATGVPDQLIGDPVRLRQIITNLVGNAIKFTDQGEIVVRVALLSSREDAVKLDFSVSDTGIGIPPDRVDKIFEAFEQVDGSTTRKYGGTGLGLSISQRLVEAMGGRIWATSTVGQGSVFKFQIELGRPSQVPATAPVLPPLLADAPILVVDDSLSSRNAMATMLSNWRLPSSLAEDGPRAFGMLLIAAQRGRPYRVALIDDRMPSMDGEELVQRIADDPRLASLAVVMLRTDPTPPAKSPHEQVRASVFKPLKQSELLDALMTAGGIPSKRQVLAASTGGSAVAVRSLKVLLAEDNLVNQKLAVLLLEKAQHVVTVVDDGRKAVEALEHETFDVVLMDVQMPIMDGFAAVTEIRLREAVKKSRVPIIAMTAHAMKGDRERCLEVGMDGYVSKPIYPADLFAEIARLIGSRASAGAAPAPAVPATSLRIDRAAEPAQPAAISTAAAKNPASEAEPPLAIDWEAALHHTGGDRDLMRTMIDVFLAESPNMLAEARRAIEANDAPLLRRSGHSIKGSCGYFAAEGAFAAALALEKMGHSGDLQDAAQTLVQLEAQLQRLRPALVAFRNGKPHAGQPVA